MKEIKKKIKYIIPIIISIYQLYLINRIWSFTAKINIMIETILLAILYTSLYMFDKKIKIKDIDKKNKTSLIIVSIILSIFILGFGFDFFTKSYKESYVKINSQNEQTDIGSSVQNIFFDNVSQDVDSLKNNNTIEFKVKNLKDAIIIFKGNTPNEVVKIVDGEKEESIEIKNKIYTYKVKSNKTFDTKSVIRLIISFFTIEIISLVVCFASYYKYKTDKSLIIPILVIVVIIRIFMYQQCQLCVKYDDSFDYQECSLSKILETGLLQERVPVYPIFIEFIKNICNDKWEVFICIVQMIISFISLIYLYKTLKLITGRDLLSSIIVFFYGISMAVIGWDTNILTESLSLSMVILFIYLLISYLQTNKLKYGLASTCVTILLCFLKPSAIAFLPILVCFYIFKFFLEKEHRKNNIKCLISVLAIIMILFSYAVIFYKQHRIFSITNVSVKQNLYVCMYEGFYKNSGDNQFIQDVEEEMKENDKKNGKEKWISMLNILDKYGNERIIKLTKESRKNSIKSYGKYLVRILKEQTNEKFTAYSKLIIPEEAYKIDTVIYKAIDEIFIIKFASIFIIAIIEGFFGFYKWIKEGKPSWIHLGLFGFILIILITAFIGTNAEFMRTSLCALPFVYISIGLIISECIEKYKNLEN